MAQRGAQRAAALCRTEIRPKHDERGKINQENEQEQQRKPTWPAAARTHGGCANSPYTVIIESGVFRFLLPPPLILLLALAGGFRWWGVPGVYDTVAHPFGLDVLRKA